MSNNHEWGRAADALYGILPRDEAAELWGDGEGTDDNAASHALGAHNFNGDGLVLEGGPAEILRYVDRLHAYCHRELDGLAGQDHPEGLVVPGEVWTAFLAQESVLDQEHPGDVSLTAIVGELRRLTRNYRAGQAVSRS